jgi:hypothetical protein
MERADAERTAVLRAAAAEDHGGHHEALVFERLRVRRGWRTPAIAASIPREASGLDVPELSSRLQFIRDEVDAREEVAEIGAGIRPGAR